MKVSLMDERIESKVAESRLLSKRLFVSVEFPQEILKELIKVQRWLDSLNLVHGSFTRPENLHLTLKFLGDCTDQQKEIIEHNLRAITFACTQSQLGGLDVIEQRNKIKIIYCTIECPELIALAAAIEQVIPFEEKKEKRAFLNHVTLMRVKSCTDQQALLREIKNYPILPLQFPVTEFFLKESQLTQQGPSYTTLARYSCMS